MSTHELSYLLAGLRQKIDATQYDTLHAAACNAQRSKDELKKLNALYVLTMLDGVAITQRQSDYHTAQVVSYVLAAL